jgi:hypothetical protein
MHGFFSFLKPLARFGLRLFLMGVVGEPVTRATRWTDIRPVFFITVPTLLFLTLSIALSEFAAPAVENSPRPAMPIPIAI